MVERVVTQENFGAWLFKASPAVWDLDAYLASLGTHFDSWSVVESYRTAMMEPGQTAFVWAGRGYRSVPSGVIAAGTINDIPYEGTGDEHWKHPPERNAIRLFAALDVTLTPRPVTREGFLKDPVLCQAEVIRQPQFINPTFLTRREVAVLEQIIRDEV